MCERLYTDYAIYTQLTGTRQIETKLFRIPRLRQERCHERQLSGPDLQLLRSNFFLTFSCCQTSLFRFPILMCNIEWFWAKKDDGRNMPPDPLWSYLENWRRLRKWPRNMSFLTAGNLNIDICPWKRHNYDLKLEKCAWHLVAIFLSWNFIEKLNLNFFFRTFTSSSIELLNVF